MPCSHRTLMPTFQTLTYLFIYCHRIICAVSCCSDAPFRTQSTDWCRSTTSTSRR